MSITWAKFSHSAATGVVLGWLAIGAMPALAFHEGGVAACDGCHIMHNSEDGAIMIEGAEPLLRASSATDVCLMCHSGQHGVFGHGPLNPPPEKGAGNFVFLLEENINDGADGLTNPIGGEAAGHSIVSADYGLGPDNRWSYSPGGTYPTSQLGCTSCHDPHGSSGFRMLHSTGPIQNGLFDFIYPAPTASGLDVSDPQAVEANESHTAYIQGMTAWCANCHGFYHDEGTGNTFEHASDEVLGNNHAGRYNRYNGASNPNGGFAIDSYLPAVPFEDDKAATTSTAGPVTGARIMCLTCHRAHASSSPAAGRWDFNVQLLEDDGLVSGSWSIPNPYGGDMAQGQLCAKCHAGPMFD